MQHDVGRRRTDRFADRDRMKKRDRAFRFPTHVTFDNEGSDIYTIIEVDTRDRPGLLYDLTRTLAANHIRIASAVIATPRPCTLRTDRTAMPPIRSAK